jgi:hypothetical protein
MTFQRGGYGCAGVAGVLGAFGIHLPKHHDFPHPIRDAIHDHFAGGGGVGGLDGGRPTPGTGFLSLDDGQPLNLVFGDPVAAETHHYSLAAIPVGGGVTMSIVALLVVIALTMVMASMTVRSVAVRTAMRT